MANANASTALHELGHLFLDGLNEFDSVDKNDKTMLDEVNKRLGVVNGVYTRKQLEKFAGSYEAYLYKGKASNATLRKVFEEFKKWLKTVYKNASEIQNADISPEVQEMFDKMFAGDKYFNERKQADELLKQAKELSKKRKNKSNLNYNELELTPTQKNTKKFLMKYYLLLLVKALSLLKYGTSSELDLKSLGYSLDYLTRICQIIKRELER